MTTEPGTTETPIPDGAPAGGTPGADGTERPGEGADEKGKLIESLQRKAAEHNALLARHGVSSVEELDARLSQPPASRAVEPTPDDEDDPDILAAGQYANDPVAKLAIRAAKENRELRKRNDMLERGVVVAFNARDIADPELRRRVVNHFNKNTTRLGDIQAALAEVQAVDLAAENKKLREENAQLSKTPDPDLITAPKTSGPVTPTGDPKIKPMRISEWDTRVEALRAQGKHHEVRALQRQLNRGEINLVKG